MVWQWKKKEINLQKNTSSIWKIKRRVNEYIEIRVSNIDIKQKPKYSITSILFPCFYQILFNLSNQSLFDTFSKDFDTFHQTPYKHIYAHAHT